jgi:hypothetical protein
MPRSDLKWIDLTDFRAGIVHNLGYFSPGSGLSGYGPGQQGMASMDSTFACIALPGGGLGPLPRQDWTYARNSPAAGGNVATWGVSFYIFGPIFPPTGMPLASTDIDAGIAYYGLNVRDVTSTTHPVEFFLGFEGVTGDHATRRTRVVRDRVFAVGNTFTGAANQSQPIETIDATNFGPNTLFAPVYFTAGHLNPDDTTQAGPTTIGINYQEPRTTYNAAAAKSFADLWPDPSNTNRGSGANGHDTDFVYRYNDAPFVHSVGGLMVYFQQRIVFLHRGGRSHYWKNGATIIGDGVKSNDEVIWTVPNGISFDPANYVNLNASGGAGYGTVHPLTASDLFLVKHSGGAVLIQGDLDNPTIRDLVNVTSTGGTECIGATSIAGFIYGVNRDGVYAWEGGDSSNFLSPQLPPDFWLSTASENMLDYKGSFATWNNKVLVPNGWVYDITNSGWWRMMDPSVFAPNQWRVNPVNGYLYGCTATVADDGTNLTTGFIRGFNPSKGANSYSWKSQPMFVQDPQRLVTVRECDFTVQGTGTIVVTVLDDTDTASGPAQTLTLAGPSTVPQFLRASLAGRAAANVKVKIVATGAGAGADPAPVIYHARFGYEEREKAATA